MTDINFYHLTSSNLEKALPQLLEKIMDAGHKVVIKVSDDQRLEYLNKSLWTYPQSSFIPHGTAGEEHIDKMPVYLSTQDDNPLDAKVLVLAYGAETLSWTQYEKVLVMFDGNDPTFLKQARSLWKSLKEKEKFKLTYFAQEDGKWQQKQTG